ncbi:CehA/McbA family metallohydrolase [candidate division KSB1 bacterium]|nr:CehA/McbA family metallohydrolase [candidate division KSB1 bacterium]
MKKRHVLLCSLFLLFFACAQRYEFEATNFDQNRWFKGNTHSHSTNSDGDAPPLSVAHWYKGHGYHFLVVSDHDTLTDVASMQSLVDSTFILIPGVEVSASNRNVPGRKKTKSLHINALNVTQTIKAIYDTTIIGTLQKNIDAITAAGGLVQINHPNYRWSISADEMKHLNGYHLFEIYNGHPNVNNLGSKLHPGTERLWDNLLSSGIKVYGVASDDAHTVAGDFIPLNANPGRGWVMVHAAALTTSDIISALQHGKFYASTGVELTRLSIDQDTLKIRIKQRWDEAYRTAFIGSNGLVLKTTEANPAVFTLSGNLQYVRASIVSSNGFRAWIQPVFVRKKS